MQSMKETAANVAASAKSGMEKTKATAQEKVEKMTAHDPLEEDMARQKKEERVDQAELNKQAAREHNAMGGGTHDYTPTGTQDYLTGSPGYTTTGGQPGRRTTEGVVGSQDTGIGRVPLHHTGARVGHPAGQHGAVDRNTGL